MEKQKSINTVNVRINKSTHEELKTLCRRERNLIGGLVDKVLCHYIDNWKAGMGSQQASTEKPTT